MGLIEEVFRNRAELMIKLLELLEGKESKAHINLDGVTFKVGKSAVVMEGSLDITFIPIKKRK